MICQSRVSVILILSKIFQNCIVLGIGEGVEFLSKSFLSMLFLTVEMLLTKNICVCSARIHSSVRVTICLISSAPVETVLIFLFSSG